MKKHFLNFLVFFFVFVFVSCSNSFSKKSSIVIQLPYGEGGERSALPYCEDDGNQLIYTYEIKLLNGKDVVDDLTGSSGDELIFQDVLPGEYSVVGTANQPDYNVNYLASCVVEVKAGEETNAYLEFKAIKSEIVQVSVKSFEELNNAIDNGYRRIGIEEPIVFSSDTWEKKSSEGTITLVKKFTENKPMITVCNDCLACFNDYAFHGECYELDDFSEYISENTSIVLEHEMTDSPLLYVTKGNLELKNCSVSNNTYTSSSPTEYGGALCVVESSSVSVTNTIFSNNGCANGYGGAIFCSNSAVNLGTGVVIQNNIAELGGGIYVCDGGTIEQSYNSTVINNFSTGDGGGVFVAKASNYKMSGGKISQNKSLKNGGGAYIEDSSLFAAYLGDGEPEISSNEAQLYGGGFYADGNSVEPAYTKILLYYLNMKNNVSDTDSSTNVLRFIKSGSTSGYINYFVSDTDEKRLRDATDLGGASFVCESSKSPPDEDK